MKKIYYAKKITFGNIYLFILQYIYFTDIYLEYQKNKYIYFFHKKETEKLKIKFIDLETQELLNYLIGPDYMDAYQKDEFGTYLYNRYPAAFFYFVQYEILHLIY